MRSKLTVNEQNHIDYAKLKLKDILGTSDCIEKIKESPNYEYILHLIAHRDALARIESQTIYHGVFSKDHDIEKIGLSLVLPKDVVKSIHKKIAKHHVSNIKYMEHNTLVEKVFDWESCHHTKLEAQETAYEYILEHHVDMLDVFKPILEELELWDKHNKEPLQKERYEQIISAIHDEHIVAELRKSYCYIEENL